MWLAQKIKDLLYKVPMEISRNYRVGDVGLVKQSIGEHYHKGWRSRDEQSAEEYQKDLEDHAYRRLERDRKFTVPWLNSVKPLRGARILEIGCGTGSSSLALAEQGATLVGIDIDEDALRAAIVFGSERTMEQVRERGLNVIEATCPLVHFAHRMVAKLVGEGYHPVIIGKRDHVEVRGIIEDLADYDVVLSEADVDVLKERPRFGIAAQMGLVPDVLEAREFRAGGGIRLRNRCGTAPQQQQDPVRRKPAHRAPPNSTRPRARGRALWPARRDLRESPRWRRRRCVSIAAS